MTTELKPYEEVLQFIKTHDFSESGLAVFCDGGWDHSMYSWVYLCPTYGWGTDGSIELIHFNRDVLLRLQDEGVVSEENMYGGFKRRGIFEVQKTQNT